jgi:hypothetical protein
MDLGVSVCCGKILNAKDAKVFAKDAKEKLSETLRNYLA